MPANSRESVAVVLKVAAMPVRANAPTSAGILKSTSGVMVSPDRRKEPAPAVMVYGLPAGGDPPALPRSPEPSEPKPLPSAPSRPNAMLCLSIKSPALLHAGQVLGRQKQRTKSFSAALSGGVTA
jgi:hypothetical protein